ncbi:MAG TPA: hypothetical protein VMM55_06370 [Thermohalobaculum sp.]|nr:hypothetical protein [Thermohalobaculum sp.]
MIEVTRTDAGDPLGFDVRVEDGHGASSHAVTMSRAQHARLAERHPPEAVVEAVFRFLLDREPKESILGRFDVSIVSRYFPEFEEKIGGYLD